MSKVVLSQVAQQFGAETVLAGINLTVNAGEFVALIGPSGCGKSTLLRLVAGLDRPAAGTITVDGVDPQFVIRSPKSRGDVAFVFQEPALLPWRSVRGNILLPLEILGRSATTANLEQLLRDVGLSPSDGRKLPRMLSGGMKMRVSLARAWITGPRLLLMDEPFGALDDMLRSELGERLAAQSAKRGNTVMFVTHHVTEAIRLADRVLIMSRHPGRIVEEFRVPFARPRAAEIEGSAEFQNAVAHVLSRLRAVNDPTDAKEVLERELR